MALSIWKTEQGAAHYSAAPGAELFLMHCHVSFQDGILLKHCIPACLFGIYPPSLGIKSCPRGEIGVFFADWCSGWGCGGSTRQSRSLRRWWNTKRKRRVKSTGAGSKMRLYWKTSFMGPGLQGEWGALHSCACFSHSPAVLQLERQSFHWWRIYF